MGKPFPSAGGPSGSGPRSGGEVREPRDAAGVESSGTGIVLGFDVVDLVAQRTRIQAVGATTSERGVGGASARNSGGGVRARRMDGRVACLKAARLLLRTCSETYSAENTSAIAS